MKVIQSCRSHRALSNLVLSLSLTGCFFLMFNHYLSEYSGPTHHKFKTFLHENNHGIDFTARDRHKTISVNYQVTGKDQGCCIQNPSCYSTPQYLLFKDYTGFGNAAINCISLPMLGKLTL